MLAVPKDNFAAEHGEEPKHSPKARPRRAILGSGDGGLAQHACLGQFRLGQSLSSPERSERLAEGAGSGRNRIHEAFLVHTRYRILPKYTPARNFPSSAWSRHSWNLFNALGRQDLSVTEVRSAAVEGSRAAALFVPRSDRGSVVERDERSGMKWTPISGQEH